MFVEQRVIFKPIRQLLWLSAKYNLCPVLVLRSQPEYPILVTFFDKHQKPLIGNFGLVDCGLKIDHFFVQNGQIDVLVVSVVEFKNQCYNEDFCNLVLILNVMCHWLLKVSFKNFIHECDVNFGSDSF